MAALLLVAALLTQPAEPPGLAAPPVRAPTTAPAPPRASADEALRRAVNEYAYGNYDKAIEQLRDLLYPMRLASDAQVIEARKYLALSYHLTDRRELMEEEFAKLLYLDPDYALDPFSIPPSLIDVFEAVRTRLKPQLDAVRLRRSDEPGDGAPVTAPGQVLMERNDLVSFLPFGIGQFQNGDTGWGLFFALAEVALIGVNIGAYLFVRYHIGDGYAVEDRSTVRLLTVAQYASVSLFGIMWTLGVFHARLNFLPTVSFPREGSPGMRALAPGALLTLEF